MQSRLLAATQGTFSDLSLRRFVVRCAPVTRVSGRPTCRQSLKGHVVPDFPTLLVGGVPVHHCRDDKAQPRAAICRFVLPGWLPPTFRGTAVRYIYYLQAVVKYRSAAASSDAGVTAGQPSSVASRAPLHLWPAKQQQLESATLERTPSLLSSATAASPAAGSAALAADGSLLSPPIQSEDVPIKCWEIGPGTAVQDAVAHIIKLATQPQASLGRPPSPGHLPRGSSGRGSGGILAGSTGNGDAGGDAHSEISHDPEEVETGPAGGGSTAGSAGVAGAKAAPPRLSLPPPPGQQQQPDPGQPGPGSSSLSNGQSTPRSARLLARRPSLARPSLEHAPLATPRSPTQLLHDGGSALRSFALRWGGSMSGAGLGREFGTKAMLPNRSYGCRQLFRSHFAACLASRAGHASCRCTRPNHNTSAPGAARFLSCLQNRGASPSAGHPSPAVGGKPAARGNPRWHAGLQPAGSSGTAGSGRRRRRSRGAPRSALHAGVKGLPGAVASW